MSSTRTLLVVTALVPRFLLLIAGNQALAQTPLPPSSPTGDEYRTHVKTDRKVYLPGESVLIRGTLLDHRFHRPLSKRQRAQAVVEICGADGVIAKTFANAEGSVLGVQWAIPNRQPPGEYKVLVRYPWSHHPPAEGGFQIARAVVHPFNAQLSLRKSIVSPGERVEAELAVADSKGNPVVGATAQAFLTVDKTRSQLGEFKIDARGRARIGFSLPNLIRRPVARLEVRIESGEALDTASILMSVVPTRVRLRVSPESGYLVAGIKSRVFVSTSLPSGEPLAISGVIVDQAGQRAGTFVTDAAGQGVFSFTPRAAVKYALRPRIPNHLMGEYPLGPIRGVGVVLESVIQHRDPAKVKFVLRSNTRQTVVVTLRQANKDVAAKIRVKQVGEVPLEFKTGGDLDGALVATVWTEDGRALAERLVFHRSSKRLKIQLQPDKKSYRAGEEVQLTIHTRDESDRPMSANLGVSATRSPVNADKFPVVALLKDEVYQLPTSVPAIDLASRHLDLLMGNQDWRRYAYLHQARFAKRYGDRALRVLARNAREEGTLRSGAVTIQYIAELRVFLIKGEAGAVKQAKEMIQALDRRPSRSPPRPQLSESIPEVTVSAAHLKAMAERKTPPAATEDERPAIWPTREFAVGGDNEFHRTVFWSASIQTDEEGKAVVRFPAKRSGPLDVTVDGFDIRGRLGESTLRIVIGD